jgi:hypothetical protein
MISLLQMRRVWLLQHTPLQWHMHVLTMMQQQQQQQQMRRRLLGMVAALKMQQHRHPPCVFCLASLQPQQVWQLQHTAAQLAAQQLGHKQHVRCMLLAMPHQMQQPNSKQQQQQLSQRQRCLATRSTAAPTLLLQLRLAGMRQSWISQEAQHCSALMHGVKKQRTQLTRLLQQTAAPWQLWLQHLLLS